MSVKKISLIAIAALLACFLAHAAGPIPGEIIVYFYDNVGEEKADQIIKGHGLEWDSFFPGANETGLRFGLIKVPIGRENFWINIFTAEEIVKRAERHIPEEDVELTPPSTQVELAPSQNTEKTVIETYAKLDYMDLLVIFSVAAFILLIFALIIISRKSRRDENGKKKKGRAAE